MKEKKLNYTILFFSLNGFILLMYLDDFVRDWEVLCLTKDFLILNTPNPCLYPNELKFMFSRLFCVNCLPAFILMPSPRKQKTYVFHKNPHNSHSILHTFFVQLSHDLKL